MLGIFDSESSWSVCLIPSVAALARLVSLVTLMWFWFWLSCQVKRAILPACQIMWYLWKKIWTVLWLWCLLHIWIMKCNQIHPIWLSESLNKITQSVRCVSQMSVCVLNKCGVLLHVQIGIIWLLLCLKVQQMDNNATSKCFQCWRIDYVTRSRFNQLSHDTLALAGCSGSHDDEVGCDVML